MDFMYDLRALALVVTGALPFAVGTQMTPDAPLLGAMIYYAGLAGAGTVSAMVIPFRSRFQPLAAFVIFSVAFASLVLAGTFTEPGSTARSLATSGGLAGGYIVGLALATTCFGVERPLLRTAAATGCIVIPWGTAFLLIRFMAQWTAALDGRLAGLPYFLAAKVLVEANVAVVGAMQRVAELDQHQTAALVVAAAASGQMISFSGFLRSYLNVEDKWDALTISGSGACVLEIFGRLLPFISSKRKKLSVIKLVIMSMTPCLKRVILLTTGLYWALSEVSNTAIRGKLRIPPMAVLASWLSGLVADTVLLVVQNYKQGQDESLWKTATRLCFTGSSYQFGTHRLRRGLPCPKGTHGEWQTLPLQLWWVERLRIGSAPLRTTWCWRRMRTCLVPIPFGF